MRFTICAVLTAALLAGCTVNKSPLPTGGSRADGTVELSYEIGEYEQAKINGYEADAQALERCKAWGYSGAQMFGGQKRQCMQPGAYGTCILYNVTLTYQCTGQGPQ